MCTCTRVCVRGCMCAYLHKSLYKKACGSSVPSEASGPLELAPHPRNTAGPLRTTSGPPSSAPGLLRTAQRAHRGSQDHKTQLRIIQNPSRIYRALAHGIAEQTIFELFVMSNNTCTHRQCYVISPSSINTILLRLLFLSLEIRFQHTLRRINACIHVCE